MDPYEHILPYDIYETTGAPKHSFPVISASLEVSFFMSHLHVKVNRYDKVLLWIKTFIPTHITITGILTQVLTHFQAKNCIDMNIFYDMICVTPALLLVILNAKISQISPMSKFFHEDDFKLENFTYHSEREELGDLIHVAM